MSLRGFAIGVGCAAVALVVSAPGRARACDSPPCADLPSAAVAPASSYSVSSDIDPTGVGLAMDLTRSTASDGLVKPGSAATWALREAMHGRASRRVAFDLGFEQAFGNESIGFRHYDLGVALPEMLFYFTPDARVQVYTLTGFQMRLAHYEPSDDGATVGVPWMNLYLGTVLGVGAEIPMADKTSVRVELRGFLRRRVDGQHENVELAAANDTVRGVTLGVGLVFF